MSAEFSDTSFGGERAIWAQLEAEAPFLVTAAKLGYIEESLHEPGFARMYAAHPVHVVEMTEHLFDGTAGVREAVGSTLFKEYVGEGRLEGVASVTDACVGSFEAMHKAPVVFERQGRDRATMFLEAHQRFRDHVSLQHAFEHGLVQPKLLCILTQKLTEVLQICLDDDEGVGVVQLFMNHAQQRVITEAVAEAFLIMQKISQSR